MAATVYTIASLDILRNLASLIRIHRRVVNKPHSRRHAASSHRHVASFGVAWICTVLLISKLDGILV